MIKPISLAEVEYIAFRLAREMLAFDEPIPDFSTRFPNVLESCLAVPFQTFSKKVLYSGLIAKASILFYLMVKNHPFQNGNKRIALTTLLYFLYKNKKWLKVEQQDLYNFIIWVAQSPAQVKQETVRGIEKFLRYHLVDL
ncbi:MAG: type II toxin-antitoxin system death-on-curing family toxin [Candidatus Saccharicenans sp.]|jgi:death-on-curing family protein|nr:type II toxin-antitoxin system death-on-curing family toxin [Candidatus Saccharicenans sp.]MDH7575334.1 type II toxin-antitoxin system death-on-curing family toxin [Candidatus Saccharicenans sp.]